MGLARAKRSLIPRRRNYLRSTGVGNLVSTAICGETCAFLFSVSPGCPLRLALAVTDLFAEG
jgi:hypothetical protein